jgi:hypothetical protein
VSGSCASRPRAHSIRIRVEELFFYTKLVDGLAVHAARAGCSIELVHVMVVAEEVAE